MPPVSVVTPNISEEEKKSIELFVKEYGELVQKHQVDFVHLPVFVPVQGGDWIVRLQHQAISLKNRPIKSPFVPQS